MALKAAWQIEDVPEPNGHEAINGSRDKIRRLKQLAIRLVRELQSINEMQVVSLDLEGGLDFYEEVSRFEIDLINRALMQTGGHQARAARLLNLKVTTLNSKIKHYKIELDSFANAFPLIDTSELETRPHA